MAAALPPSTAQPVLTRHSAAGLLPFRRARRGQYAAPQHGGCCARQLPAAATAGATCGLTRRATAVAAAQGRAQAGEGAEKGSLVMVQLSTAVAVCGSLEFGTCVGYSAPAQAGIVSDIGLSNSQYGIFGSVLTIGAMIGALTSGRLADTLGRKTSMRLAAIVGIFGWLAIYLAKDATMLYLGRVLLGYCTGVLSYAVPVFISEISPKDLRGGLAASNQLFICSGCSAAYIIGAMVSWRSLVIVGLVPCAFLLVGLPFIPESPRWLIENTVQGSNTSTPTRNNQHSRDRNICRNNPEKRGNKASPPRSLQTPAPPLATSCRRLRTAAKNSDSPANPSSDEAPRRSLLCGVHLGPSHRQGTYEIENTGGAAPHNYDRPTSGERKNSVLRYKSLGAKRLTYLERLLRL